MAAVFSAECLSCGEHHECCFAESDFVVQGHEYYFECPNSGQQVTVLGPVGWHMVNQLPAYAIALTRNLRTLPSVTAQQHCISPSA